MSALLKADDRAAQSEVRHLATGPLGLSESTDSALSFGIEADGPAFGGVEQSAFAHIDELVRRCEMQEETIADLRGQLEQAENAAAQQVAQALALGRDEGKELADTGETGRLSALAASLTRIEREHADRMVSCELLALQLARTALARMLGERTCYAELISSAVGVQLDRLKPDLAVAVRVSTADFADEAILEVLSEEHGGISVVADDALRPGECLLKLKLGQIDLGIPGQWNRLNRYFEELADAGQLA